MYYNGYLPATVIANSSGSCVASATACVKGIPSGYAPVVNNINPAVANGTVDANFNNTNNVIVKLKDGTNQLVAYDTGLNPLAQSVRQRALDHQPIGQRVQERPDHRAGASAHQCGCLQRAESAGHRDAEHRRHHQPAQFGARRAYHAIHRPADLVVTASENV